MTIHLSEARLAGSKKKVLVLGLAAMIASASLLAGPVESAHAAFPGQNGRLAFTSNRDGNFEVYTMNPDGTDQKRLTNVNETEFQPTWSPDCKKIAFTRRVTSDTDIAVVNTDGSGLIPIEFGPGDQSEPAFSVDSRIAYVDSSDGDREIYTMDADGSNKKQLTKNNDFEGAPGWSPNGKKIVFESQRDPGNSEIYKMNADGSSQKRLTKNGVPDSNPTFSPDGKKIAFTSNATIREMNSDGSKQKTIAGGGNADPDWGVVAS